ncbi:alpha-amylase family protein [Paenibacillus koleovorans]|uniref:alpha-amylase family protein n=1 Tax=Paenibacillus koleovorans TaxID=121608 RepID=UPI0013E2E6FB|nr:alpha-amylase family protein [Paenibacillus koleovorans]
MNRLATRQVHLDFHTSEWIPEVGTRFSKENFQEALRLGKLNSITVFAKCHHSWSYYPTEAGTMHPELDFDLTGAMIEAAHEIGVKAPVYITVGWSSNDAEAMPHCVTVTQDDQVKMSNGTTEASPDEARPIVSWKFLCPSGDYADLIYKQTREICDRYANLDGLFYDICFHHACWCRACVETMRAEGLNPDDLQDAETYKIRKWRRFTEQCTAILREKHPEATIFFNGGAHVHEPVWHDTHTHIEMEDLPTTWGGYDKMPLRAKYFARYGKDYLGMTGKFHTMWGEFGGFKPADAMRFESAAMLAYGARCSIGDQMHPCGEMDLETYRLIGEAYAYVEQIEPWCFDVEETSRLGIFLSGSTESDEGLAKILLDRQLDFDLVLESADLLRFDAVILPDQVKLNETWAQALGEFAARGGGVLLTGKSGLDEATGSRFALDIGAEHQGASPYDCDYLQLDGALAEGLVTSPFLFYEPAQQLRLTDGEPLASIREPYFSRTYARYCSHQNTPYKLEPSDSPGAVRKGSVVYLAHPIGRLYFKHGAQFHRDYLINALKLVYREPVMRIWMPSAARVRFVRQPAESRYVLHLLYGSPIQRGRTSVIEDLPPIRAVRTVLRVEEPIRTVSLAPQGAPLSFTQRDGVIELIVPEVLCHQIVVLDY